MTLLSVQVNIHAWSIVYKDFQNVMYMTAQVKTQVELK